MAADDSLAESEGCGFSTVGDLEFGADVIDMIPDRVVANLERARDFLVRETSRDHLEYFDFASAQARAIIPFQHPLG